jgi:glycosyltransferase involved in cell wall biosynthesis
MMESMHTALEAFGWTTDFFTADDMPASASQRFRRYAFSWYVREHARQAYRRGEPYSIINVHEPRGAAVVVGKSRLGNPAIVAMSHGVEQRYWEMRLEKGLPRLDPPSLKERLTVPLTSLWQANLTLRRADHVLCLNEEDRIFLATRFDLDPGKVTRVFSAAGNEFSSVASRRCYERPCTKVLFYGSWIERKGIRQVIESFSILASRHPSLQLGVLGGGVPVSCILENFPAHLRSQITIYPSLSHSECAEVLLGYDMLLLPSYFEGTPLALIEAMCTGMPVITTATCGMKDVIVDGQNGLLVPTGDTGKIISAVEQLMADSNLRERLGRQAQSEAVQKYTWQTTAKRVNDVYSSLLRP